MLPDSTRAKMGKWAGQSFTVANTGLVFKGLLNSAWETGAFDATALDSDIMSTVIGLTAVTASTLLALKGDNNKWVGISMGLATFRKSLFAYETMRSGHPLSSTAGALISAALSAQGCYQSYKRQKQRTTPKSKGRTPATSSIEKFMQTAADITQAYPFAPVGLCNIVTNLAILHGALNTNDPVLVGIATLWTIGSGFLTLALPRVVQTSDNKPASR